MPHLKQHITDLAEICFSKDIRRVVISPGSRSAPLIKAFLRVFGEGCISLVDERSAAYFALGMALHTRAPVILICTSGTAVLNYAPALAEAYYQHVPLLAVTADRPREWIDQQDNQTLRQTGIYNKFVKGSYDLPQAILSEDDLWYARRMINEAVDLSVAPAQGPVHINVPLTEPLYEELPSPPDDIGIIRPVRPEISVNLPDELVQEWRRAERIMIIHGQDHPGSAVSPVLKLLSNDPRIIVMAENIANVSGKNMISNSNLVLINSRKSSPEKPDLVLHSGGQVVSKALTGYLRRAGNLPCWRIGIDNTLIDTFKLLTRYIQLPAENVYRAFSDLGGMTVLSSFRESWLHTAENVSHMAQAIIQDTPFTDLRVMDLILRLLPRDTALVLGNSSVIRYAQIFPSSDQVQYYANRGVSGIDGTLSTAAGIAQVSEKLTMVLTGDLGFIYDSNALWNRRLPSNLRILVINNGGGGIFHILKGPSDQPGFKDYVEANHPVDIGKLAGAYGLDHYYAEEGSGLENQWENFIRGTGKAAVFEVKTDAVTSAAAFRRLMQIPR